MVIFDLTKLYSLEKYTLLSSLFLIASFWLATRIIKKVCEGDSIEIGLSLQDAIIKIYNTNGQEIQFTEKLDTKTNTLLIEPKNLANSELVFVTIKFFDGSVQNKKVLVYAK